MISIVDYNVAQRCSMKKLYVILFVISMIVFSGCQGTITGEAKGGKGKPSPSTQCLDNQDNDGDGFCDYDGCYLGKKKRRTYLSPDPDCESGYDDDESTVITTLGPDLVVTSIRLLDKNTGATYRDVLPNGVQYYILPTVRNDGDEPAVFSSNGVHYSQGHDGNDQGLSVCKASITLNPGESIECDQGALFGSSSGEGPGDYVTVESTIDYHNSIAESDDTNNMLQINVFVGQINTCTDTDDHPTINSNTVKGTVSGQWNGVPFSHTDSCIDSYTLKEWYCGIYGPGNIQISCSGGSAGGNSTNITISCFDGACV
ncbi:hypothetical protein ACFL1B_04045 [Nanoarchaeota archaeon]